MKVYQAARNKLSLRVLHSQDQPVFFAVFHLKIYIYKYIYENKVTDIIVSAHWILPKDENCEKYFRG